MFSLYKLPEAQVLLFALVLLRISAFLVSAAFFSSPLIQMPMKLLLCLALAMVLFPVIPIPSSADSLILSNEIVLLVLREVIVGLTLGFLTRFFFMVVTMAGELITTSIGLGAAQMFNPMMGSNGSAMEQFMGLIGTLVFLAVDGHHLVISGLAESFHLIPVTGMTLKHQVFQELALMGQTLLFITVKIAAPIMVSILLANMAMGILGRAVPQINVLVTSMPVTLMLGFGVLLVCLPLMVTEMNFVLDQMATRLLSAMKAM